MTKPSLYARAAVTLQLAAGLALTPAGAFAQTPEGCRSCLLPVITPARAASLPDRLDGLDILVAVPAGRERDADDAAAAIRGRGGRPGLLVSGLPQSVGTARAVTDASIVVIDIRGEAAPSPDDLAFALKKHLTALRGSVRAATIGVMADGPLLDALLARDLSAYVDFVIASAAPVRETAPGRRAAIWGRIDAPDLRAALAATRASATERWIWPLPEDADPARLLAELLAPATEFVEEMQVLGSRRLTAEEIVARHQAAANRQTAAIREVISTGHLTITFEAPGFPAPVTISAETVVYAGRDRTDLEQRRIRVNGIEFKGGVPRLPIIEPERAASPPLAITLTNVYRYALAGEEDAGGVRCFVIAFEPAADAAGGALFRGRAWIAADSFAMVKVAAAQTGLRGAIVSSEQIDEFRHEGSYWLLHRSEVRQLYEGAGHRTPIVRVLQIAAHEVNPADFAERRRSAYASSNVMLRDTPEGYRYLKRQAHGPSGGQAAEPEVAGRAERVRTLAGGVLIDPNISRPLPFAGLSYVDFDVFGTGAQLNAFAGGTYGQLAFSVPSLGGSRWQVAGRAFGIATAYNDRAFAGGRERYEHNIEQRPAHVSVWLLRPLTATISLRAGYDLDYTHFARGGGTAANFVVPQSQLIHGARLALDAQRGGWAASMWWNPARRQGWRAWGVAGTGEYRRGHRDFQRYGASLARSIILRPGLVGRVETAWMAGRDLDRFSRYAFGSFDNRLRGYPSALIRYDRGGVLRGAIAWSAGGRLRLDGFVDTAAAHDPSFGPGLRNYTGIGAAVEMPAPFGTLVAVEWGYGFRGVNTDGTLGTQVVRISAFKIF